MDGVLASLRTPQRHLRCGSKDLDLTSIRPCLYLRIAGTQSISRNCVCNLSAYFDARYWLILWAFVGLLHTFLNNNFLLRDLLTRLCGPTTVSDRTSVRRTHG